ncbi:MAG: ABC-type transport system, involved in lipoprotein release, permease component [Frankiales bacterium]|nr:ABC-type transport system, involved in lipoprotein release, permease component [Frankiales bacterium]
MFATALSSLLAHKLRMLAVATAVLLGVAFMAGTLVLTDTVGRTFDNLFGDVYKNTDVVVRAKAAFDGPTAMGAQRGRVDAAALAAVRAVPGVREAQGNVLGYARLIAKDGHALGHPSNGAPALGGDWTVSTRLNPYTLAAGSPPTAADDVVIDRKSARDGDLQVGSVTTVLVQGPPMKVRVSGIATFGSTDSPGGATVVLFRSDVAQRVIAAPGTFDQIAVAADRDVSSSQLASRVRAVIPSTAEAVTGAAVTKETQDAMAVAFSFFTTFMLVFALIALLVGAFMIFNTFSITVAQRTRENGLLRALGATRRQVLAAVLLEALIIGVLASVAGLFVGLGVAVGLKGLLGLIGFDIPASGVVFTLKTVLVSVLVGVAVTCAAALSPARKAGRVPPIAAMQAGNTGVAVSSSRRRVVVGTILTAGGVATLMTGLFSSVGKPVTVVGVGALLVLFGVSVLGPTVARPLSRIIGAPLARLRGVTGDLARENAMRNPRRTAATSAALMIGVALVGFITIFVASAKASLNDTIDRAFTGDIVVNTGAGMSGGVDPAFARGLTTLPEIAAASGVRQSLALVAGDAAIVTAADPKQAFQILDIKPLSGSPDQLGVDAIAVHKDTAARLHVRVGDVLPVVFKDTGPKSMRIAMIYGEIQPARTYFMSMAAYDANFSNRYDTMVFVKKAATADAAAALQAVKQAAAAYPGVDVLDRAGFKTDQSKPFNQMLTLVYALLGLAILIALLGIANTLALSVFERTHEIGLLRAVGMTRAQLRASLRWESAIIALQGTALGLVIGIFFGWALVRASSSLGITTFALPVPSLGVIVVLAALAGMVAAIGPARRAARLNVLKAIVST